MGVVFTTGFPLAVRLVWSWVDPREISPSVSTSSSIRYFVLLHSQRFKVVAHLSGPRTDKDFTDRNALGFSLPHLSLQHYPPLPCLAS